MKVTVTDLFTHFYETSPAFINKINPNKVSESSSTSATCLYGLDVAKVTFPKSIRLDSNRNVLLYNNILHCNALLVTPIAPMFNAQASSDGTPKTRLYSSQ